MFTNCYASNEGHPLEKNEVRDKIPVAGKWCRAQMFTEVYSWMDAINGSTGSCYNEQDIYWNLQMAVTCAWSNEGLHL